MIEAIELHRAPASFAMAGFATVSETPFMLVFVAALATPIRAEVGRDPSLVAPLMTLLACNLSVGAVQ